MKTDIDQSQINNLQHFPLVFQNNHYEVDLLSTSTFKPIAYSHWIEKYSQQKRIKQHHNPHKKDPFPLVEKEKLTDTKNLSGPFPNNSKYTINQVFNLHYPLDTVPLSKIKVENSFLPTTVKTTLELLQKNQNLDPVIRQLKLWQKYKTKQPKLIPQT